MAITEGNISADTTKVTRTDGTIAQREAVLIADPEITINRANVFPIPAIQTVGETYAAAVTDWHLEFLQETMSAILIELKNINRHLNVMTDEDFTND